MTLIIYLLCFALLSFLLRGWSQRFRSLLITGFNFTFAAVMFFLVQARPGMTAGEVFAAVGSALSSAPAAIAFQGNAALFGPDVSYVFFLMSLHTIRTVLVLFFRGLFVRARMKWRLLTRKTIYIVTGARKDAAWFIRDLNRCRPRSAVVYLTEQDPGEAPLDAYETGAAFLRRLKRSKSYQLLLLPAEGQHNYQRLIELEELGKQGISLRVTAFLDNELLRTEDMTFPHLDLYLLSRERMVVEDFLRQNLPLARLRQLGPPPETGHIFRPQAPFSLCLIGFGAFSREFLLQTYENTAFTTAAGVPALEVLAADSDLAGKKAAFLSDFPHMARTPGLHWLDAPVPSDALFQALSERRFHQVLIATPDTEENVCLALRLRRLFARRAPDQPQLVVALFQEDAGAVALLKSDSHVSFQQVNQCQFTYENLVVRSADRQAEELHRRYQRGSLFTPQWRELSAFTQASNRAAVWDIPNKLLLAGDTSALDPQAREALCWELAQYEHLRWNAFHFARGWLPLPLEEMTPEERAQCRTKRPGEKRHACLVDWDQLDALPQKEPGLLKRYDYENVACLFLPREEC